MEIELFRFVKWILYHSENLKVNPVLNKSQSIAMKREGMKGASYATFMRSSSRDMVAPKRRGNSFYRPVKLRKAVIINYFQRVLQPGG